MTRRFSGISSRGTVVAKGLALVAMLVMVQGTTCPILPTPDPNLCGDTTCADGETCVDGVCVADDPCADVTCDAGETCVDGVCEADPTSPDALAVTAVSSSATASVGGTVDLLANVTGGSPPFTYQWTLTSSTAGASITNGTSQTATASFSASGTFTFNVFVQDADGASSDGSTDVTASGGSTALTFTLGVDDLSGSADDDSFTAPALLNSGTGTQLPSLQTGDAADGLAGTDTLDATFSGAIAATTTVSPSLTDVEVLNVTDFRSGNFNTVITGTNVTGLTEFNAVGGTHGALAAEKTGDLVINNLAGVANVGLTNTTQDINIGFVSAATSGAADAITVNVNNSTSATLLDRSTVTITTGSANGFETLTVNSSGSASKLLAVTQATGSTATTLNVTGDKDLSIGVLRNAATIAAGVSVGALDNSITTVDASAFTGNLAGSEGVIVGTGIVAFTGGSGDDEVMYAVVNAGPAVASTYVTTDIIDGGAGTDTLGLTNAAVAPTTNQTNVTNMEGIRVIDELTASPILSRWGTGVTNVTLDDGGNGGTITYPAGTGNVLNLGSFGITDSVGSGTLGATISGSATTDAITINLNDADHTGAVTITGAETVNLVSNVNLNGAAASGGANVFAATFIQSDTASPETLNISGNEAVTFTGAVTTNTLNASALTDVLTVTAGTAAASSITGGTANDVINGSGAADSINGGDGNDVLDGRAGADLLAGGAGNDDFRVDESGAIDTISDWADGSDFLTVSSAAADFGTGLAQAGGAAASLAPTAISAAIVTSVAANSGATAIGTTQFLKLTTAVANAGTDQTTFNAAIGTSTVTGLTANTFNAVSYYDTTNSQMVVCTVNPGGADTTIASADVIAVIVKIAMSSTDYTNFTNADLVFADIP